MFDYVNFNVENTLTLFAILKNYQYGKFNKHTN